MCAGLGGFGVGVELLRVVGFGLGFKRVRVNLTIAQQ